MKVVAEGFHSSIDHAFVAVIRDAETYAELSKLAGNLPNLDVEFFKSNAIIAAFLGERNTGGYAVEINRDIAGEIHIIEKTPDKGMMVPQVITSPFKIVSVPLRAPSPLWFTLGDAWHRRMVQYKLTDGQFKMSGGIAGTRLDFSIEGSVSLLHEGNLATFALSLNSKEILPKRSVLDFATGAFKDNAIKIRKLSAGSLVEPPNNGLQAVGGLSDGDKKLRLSFVSLPSMIADGFTGQGSIEAEAAAIPKS
jgi:PrcB C-terminal